MLYIGLYANNPLFSSDFLINLNFLDRCSKNVRIQNFLKIRHLGTELFHADRQKDRKTGITKLIVAFAVLRTCLKMIPRSF